MTTTPHNTAFVTLSPSTPGPAEGETPLLPGVPVVEIPAVVRTAVPVAVGGVVSALATMNIRLDEAMTNLLSAGLTGLFAVLYYVVAHALESRWPSLSLLLGSTARPTYTGRHRKGSRPATATPDAPESETDRQLS